jgi:putative Holliday junction resolvase
VNRPRNSARSDHRTEPSRLLCFDYGAKRIGVAVGQSLTGTATPLEIVAARRGRPDWNRIAALIAEWRPDALVVGNPLNMDGTRQEATDAADRFARRLEGRFGLPVYREDERLSTVEAKNLLRSTRDLDAVSAQLILESWLAGRADGNRAAGTPGDRQ